MNFCTTQYRENLNKKITFRGQTITLCKNIKFLGLELDLNLCCIFALIVNSVSYKMMVLRNLNDLKTRIIVYYAYYFQLFNIEF